MYTRFICVCVCQFVRQREKAQFYYTKMWVRLQRKPVRHTNCQGSLQDVISDDRVKLLLTDGAASHRPELNLP